MEIKGYLKPVPIGKVHVAVPHFPVPKPHDPTKKRIVGDFRFLNKWIEKEECQYPRLESLWMRCALSSQVSTCDIEDGFYQVRVPEEYRKYFGLVVNGNAWWYTRMPQGFINSPAIFTKFMGELLPQDPRLAFYMDDVFGFDMDEGELLDMVAATGLPIKTEKTGNSKDGYANVLGVEIRHRYGCLNAQPLPKTSEKLEGLCKHAIRGTKRQLYALAGFLQFYAPFLPQAHAFLMPLYRACAAAKNWEDRPKWWPTFPIQDFWPFSVTVPAPGNPVLHVDASQEGYGATLVISETPFLHWTKLRLSKTWKNTPGIYRELQAAAWSHSRLPFEVPRATDSEPLVRAYQKGAFTSWKAAAHQWLAKLSGEWTYVPGHLNEADLASRPLYHWIPKGISKPHNIRRAGRRNERKKAVKLAPPPTLP